MRPIEPGDSRRERGYTLVELLVSLLVMSLVLVAAYTVFDFQTRLAQVQTQVSEMQQSQRIGQYQTMRETRMAGRGGVPADVAIEVRNNVGEGGTEREVLIGFADSPVAVEGSDILVVRGVFNTPIYQLRIPDPTAFTVDMDEGTGSILIRDPTPSGVPQDLTILRDILEAEPFRPEAIVVASAFEDGVYAVVELTGGEFAADETRLDFRFEGGVHTDAYLGLTPGGVFPEEADQAIGFIGILEEYRYYIREVEDQARLVPRLSRARVYPGTAEPYAGNAANTRVDIADNVFDLQVALGFDTDGDGVVRPDEWLFAEPGQDPTQPPWNNPQNRLGYVRINTLARTPQPHIGYLAPVLTRIEDREYGEEQNDVEPRRHRRRHMETIVELRNV